jgi:chaperone modulatory protein CbpM
MTEWEFIQGEPMDETIELSPQEICRICGIREAVLIEMVEEGLVEPSREHQWTFSGVALTRIRTALRLQRDLDINLTAVAITLDLLDEIAVLRRRLNVQMGPRD